MSEIFYNDSGTCPVKLPNSTTGTGFSESNSCTIISCSFDCGCYVKEGKFWCNHCSDIYSIIDEIIHDNPNLPLGAYMGICMKQLRGKCSGELCNKIINLLTERRKQK